MKRPESISEIGEELSSFELQMARGGFMASGKVTLVCTRVGDDKCAVHDRDNDNPIIL